MTHTKIKSLFKSTQIIVIFMFLLGSNYQIFGQEYNNEVSDTDLDLNGVFDFSEEINYNLNYYSVKDTGDVIHTIYTPTGNNQGLTWDGEYLWCSSISLYMIYKLDPIDGTIVNSFPAPGGSNEGLAWDGTYLYACENGGGAGNPDYIYKLDTTDGTIISSIQPESMSWPHGITWDGQYLWTNNFGPKTITKIDPENGQVLHTIPAPGEKSIGLTWDGQHLWTDDFDEDLLYKISPEDGSVIYTVASPHTNPRDLAWDGQYLWVLAGGTAYQVDVGYTTSVLNNSYLNTPKISGFPNPFKEIITINYSIDQPSSICISISDFSGKHLKVLEKDYKTAGDYEIQWNGNTGNNQRLPNGVYFCTLKTENTNQAFKIILSK
ncbi:MAG: T9SS type A sorting domain-containing protein [Bacteroidales bacterium]|nr:T9SS type A sorting domain-containing protein [Bacteroidales bacterium]